MAIAAATDITFKEAVLMKEYLADPSKFSVISTGPAAGGGSAAAEEKKEEKKRRARGRIR